MEGVGIYLIYFVIMACVLPTSDLSVLFLMRVYVFI